MNELESNEPEAAEIPAVLPGEEQLVEASTQPSPPTGGLIEEPPPPLAPLLIKGGIFALVAALICAFIWGKVAEISGYEIGYLALGVGWVVGFAFMIGSNGSAGIAGVGVAVAISLLSVVLGKFYATSLAVPDINFGLLTYLTEIYPQHLADPMDALWLALAGYMAMKIASKSATR